MRQVISHVMSIRKRNFAQLDFLTSITDVFLKILQYIFQQIFRRTAVTIYMWNGGTIKESRKEYFNFLVALTTLYHWVSRQM